MKTLSPFHFHVYSAKRKKTRFIEAFENEITTGLINDFTTSILRFSKYRVHSVINTLYSPYLHSHVFADIRKGKVNHSLVFFVV